MSDLERLIRAKARPGLPVDERRDVGSQLYQLIKSGLGRSDFIAGDEMRQWQGDFARNFAPDIQKAVVLNEGYREMAYPAGDARWEGHKGILQVNELGVGVGAAVNPWADKPTATGGFDFLRYMSDNLDAHQAIVFTRQHQVATFIREYEEDDNNPLGIRLARKDGEKITDRDKKEIARIMAQLMSCGLETDPIERKRLQRRDFPGFTNAWVADTLTYDATPTEIEPTRDGRQLSGFYNLDPRTIRRCFETGYMGDSRIYGVQLAPEGGGMPWVGFEHDELVYEVRNPRSDVYYGSYGKCELEAFIRGASAYVNACTFNAARQDRNSIPRGILTLYGRFDSEAMVSFKEQWNALLRGAAKRWSLPVITADSKNEGGAAYTPVDTAVDEMSMTKWIIFQVSLLASFYGVDPVELNMESFTSKVSSLSGKDTSEKLQSSHDRGLIPLMQHYERWINTHILPRLTTKYRAVFVGLFPDDEERKEKRQLATLTVDELRAIDGGEPHTDPDIGNAPVNQAHMQLYMLKQQSKMGLLAKPGEEGAPGGDEDEDADAGGGGPFGGLPGGERPLLDHYDGGKPTIQKARRPRLVVTIRDHRSDA